MDGTVREIGDRYVLRFEREFAHPVGKVWSMLTESDRIGRWLALAESGEIELRVGGRVHLAGEGIESTVTEVEPQRVLAYGWRTADWDGGVIRFELEPTTAGTRLIFTHDMSRLTEDQARGFRERIELPEGWEQLSSTLAGWHTIFDRLARALEDDPVEYSIKAWRELNEHYKRTVSASRRT